RGFSAQCAQARHEHVLETRRVDPRAEDADPGGLEGRAEILSRAVGVGGENVQMVPESLDVDDRLVRPRISRQPPPPLPATPRSPAARSSGRPWSRRAPGA